jgi:hypothetical protein
MDYFLLHKKTLLLIGALLLIAIVLVTIGFIQFMATQSESERIQNSSLLENNQQVAITITPVAQTILPAGEKQTFTLTFTPPQNKTLFHASLTVKTVSNNQDPRDIPLQLLSSTDSSLVVASSSTITPDSIYEFTLINKKTNEILFKASYTSSPLAPTPIAKNNSELATYLPYQTPTYSLEYNKEENLYIFHFIYNPNSSLDAQTQFLNAQSQAQAFIRSKSIDPESVVIEWKRY